MTGRHRNLATVFLRARHRSDLNAGQQITLYGHLYKGLLRYGVEYQKARLRFNDVSRGVRSNTTLPFRLHAAEIKSLDDVLRHEDG